MWILRSLFYTFSKADNTKLMPRHLTYVLSPVGFNLDYSRSAIPKKSLVAVVPITSLPMIPGATALPCPDPPGLRVHG